MAVEAFVLIIYLGGLSVILGVLSLYFWLTLQRLHDEVPSVVSGAVAGRLMTLVGRVSAPTTSVVKSPYGEQPCVCFVSSVEQKTAHLDPRRGFVHPTWESIGTSVRSAPFVLTDASGSIFVMASRAQLSLQATFTGELDTQHRLKRMSRFFGALVRRFAPLQALWVTECLLREGDTVFVSGVPRPLSSLDKQLLPPRYHDAVQYALKGEDVVVSTSIPAAHIPMYEKCFWFSFASASTAIALLVVLLLFF